MSKIGEFPQKRFTDDGIIWRVSPYRLFYQMFKALLKAANFALFEWQSVNGKRELTLPFGFFCDRFGVSGQPISSRTWISGENRQLATGLVLLGRADH